MSDTGRQWPGNRLARAAAMSEQRLAAAARSTRDALAEPPRTGAGSGRHLEVPAQRLLQNWKTAHERALAYLNALGVAEPERDGLVKEALARAVQTEPWEPTDDAVGVMLRALRRVLLERLPVTARSWVSPTDDFLSWRLEAAISGRFTQTETDGRGSTTMPVRRGRFTAAPELTRGRMVPERIERRIVHRLFQRLFGGRAAAAARRARRRRRRELPWRWAAIRRRLLLTVLVLIPSVVASGFMVDVLPRQGGTGLEAAIVLVFGALFGWISIGFWSALLGFFCLLRGDRFAINSLKEGEDGRIAPEARTAIVMPICNEPVDRVFAGLQAIHRSLARMDALGHFHFFVLSDSGDAGTAVREEEAWFEWCRAVDGFDHIFYRRRRVRLRRKSGNIADFCRRWGKQYRYMIMLDADSVMAGETMVRMVQLMERHPKVGIIQTAPTAVNRHSLFARVQQFASRVYAPMFAAGLHYWQLGDGQYWGHNAIIRVEPFMAHCGLPRLPGRPPLGGEIMSHDFVEAALMGRSGWSSWLAFDMPGSYEEVPSTLLDEMQRDRRWCQGNLQHLRLLFTEGLFGAHRALFLNGVLSYVSAVLWLVFLSLSTAAAILNVLLEPDYFPSGPSLFPDWPVWRPNWAVSLLAVTAVILFLPKLLSVLLIAARRQAASFGGFFKLVASVLLEIVLSSLFAPIRMVFHSRFVVLNLLGRTVAWRSQRREDGETDWWEAVRHHGLDTLLASAWGVGLYWLNPSYFWWVMPVIGALILSVPLSVLVSRVGYGEQAAERGLFITPEESAPCPELRDLVDLLAVRRGVAADMPEEEEDGLVRATVDPYVNALHRGLLRGPRSLAPGIRSARRALLEHALAEGPAALSAREREILLGDGETVAGLHDRAWEETDQQQVARWGRVEWEPEGRRL